ncbi:MAG: hypothetical protein AAF662_11360 [Pseudomonadota bacterium]
MAGPTNNVPRSTLADMKRCRPEIEACVDELVKAAKRYGVSPFAGMPRRSLVFDYCLMRSFGDLQSVSVMVEDSRGRVVLTRELTFEGDADVDELFGVEGERPAEGPVWQAIGGRAWCSFKNSRHVTEGVRKLYEPWLRIGWSSEGETTYAEDAVHSKATTTKRLPAGNATLRLLGS